MEKNYDALYKKVFLKDFVKIDEIVTIHYFEFAKDYVFSGERHNFWEFVYIDKGKIEILAGNKGYRLEQGDIVFHKPNEFHSVWADGKTAPNIMIASFVCNSPCMSFFENKILNLTTSQIEILGKIYEEGKHTFITNLNGTYSELVKKDKSDIFASEQLIKLYLELFIITLLRDKNSVEAQCRISKTVQERIEEDITQDVISFLKKNVYSNLSFDDVCLHFCIGKTCLKTIFKNKTNCGVMHYFNDLKIQEAKKLIREKTYNFTQISELLCYDSVNYFSRCFKKFTNMTPSEYAVSIKSRTDS